MSSHVVSGESDDGAWGEDWPNPDRHTKRSRFLKKDLHVARGDLQTLSNESRRRKNVNNNKYPCGQLLLYRRNRRLRKHIAIRSVASCSQTNNQLEKMLWVPGRGRHGYRDADF